MGIGHVARHGVSISLSKIQIFNLVFIEISLTYPLPLFAGCPLLLECAV